MSARSRRRWLLVLPGAPLLVCACHTWRVQSIPPETLLGAPAPPSSVRLKLEDSSAVVLRRPRLSGDSVSGTLSGSEKGTVRTIPLEDVREIAVRRFSAGRTLGLVAAGAAGLVAFGAIGCEMTDCAGVDFGTSSAAP